MAGPTIESMPQPLISIIESYLTQLSFYSESRQHHLEFCASSAQMSPNRFEQVVEEYKNKFPVAYQMLMTGKLAS